MWPFGKRKTPDLEELCRHRIIRLDGEITEATAQMVISQLLFLQHEDARQPVTLCIESRGGSVTAGMAIVDTVRELEPLVCTWAPTMAHGMAAIVLASGGRGERVVGPTAQLSLTPLEVAADWHPEVNRIRQQLASVIAELCGQHLEVISQHLLDGLLLTPSEAVAYGLADQVGA
ncbi:ATP-dependent Clp protease proteolytic subunit [Trichocoleus sp. FACHB-591]|uniref:ATP-dependent Clp protease proteolytic subunit n=1 Tax=Trichocoleus sp. FACHB-591 TaxID=2692872 RepID=UPI00168394FF|nr:ATP-dependent Clp protease proteolytic subunit [Trichocoleus sp. FACHB-591]